jgi:hypothetical protein
MKFLSAFVSVFIVFGCGILSAIFDLPERYIERDVALEEMVGTWKITSDSEADVKAFVTRVSGWGIYMYLPFTILTLNDDGTCTAEHEANWLDEAHSSDTSIVRTTSCFWDLAKEENLSDKISPVIKLDFEYSNPGGRKQSLYIYEENGELIVWSFIGDPDDFRTQDFVK